MLLDVHATYIRAPTSQLDTKDSPKSVVLFGCYTEMERNPLQIFDHIGTAGGTKMIHGD